MSNKFTGTIMPGSEDPKSDGTYVVWYQGNCRVVNRAYDSWFFWHEEAPEKIDAWMKIPGNPW